MCTQGVRNVTNLQGCYIFLPYLCSGKVVTGVKSSDSSGRRYHRT